MKFEEPKVVEAPKHVKPNIDVDEISILKKCIKLVWDEYDVDKSGYLDKEECRAFINGAVKEIGDGEHFCNKDFENCFAKVDVDGNG